MAPLGIWADQPFDLLETPGKTQPLSDPVVYVATHMALVHNTFIRGLNTIYLQAPYIPPSDPKLVNDFFTYCQCWSALIALHHEAEETHLFSTLESRIPAAKGIFEVNVDQHKKFHNGLHEFEIYSRNGVDGKEKFSAKKIMEMIDSFSVPLMQHLKDEIPTLMSLQQSGQGKEVLKIHEEYEVLVRKDIDTAKVAPFTLLNSDRTFKNGEHPFPVMPFFVPYLIKYLVSRKHAGAWKFGSTDYFGQPKTLWMNGREKMS